MVSGSSELRKAEGAVSSVVEDFRLLLVVSTGSEARYESLGE